MGITLGFLGGTIVALVALFVMKDAEGSDD